MILRALYSAVWMLATPLIRRYLRKRARRAPDYLEYWDERFGTGFKPAATGAIWIHAVSVGETRAAQPLIEALRQQWPEASFLITQMTPTGRACAMALYGDFAEVRYLPYDRASAVRDFIHSYQPRFGVLMETEIWPNLIAATHRAGIPLFLANARLSEKSYRGYRKVACLIAPALQQLSAVAAQNQADAERLKRLGAGDIRVCGNTKYDFSPPSAQLALGDQFRARIGSRQVVVCASTRDGEEKLILEAWRHRGSDCLLVMVPRHPERFKEVGKLAREAGFTVQYRSDQMPLSSQTDVWIGDSMGELFAYYRTADLVFIGGSLLPLGGQNLIEPASLGVPVLMGPSTFNFADASAQAFSSGAAIQVRDAEEFVAKVNYLLCQPDLCAGMRQAALGFSAANRGASQRILDLICSRLSVSEKQL